MTKEPRFTINGRRWRFVRERLPDDRDGSCDPPDKPNKAMRVDSRLRDFEELETIIHEAKHAESWDMYDETFVERTSKDLAKFLWRLGYRRLR